MAIPKFFAKPGVFTRYSKPPITKKTAPKPAIEKYSDSDPLNIDPSKLDSMLAAKLSDLDADAELAFYIGQTTLGEAPTISIQSESRTSSESKLPGTPADIRLSIALGSGLARVLNKELRDIGKKQLHLSDSESDEDSLSPVYKASRGK